MTFSALPARFLDQRELAELVENLAGRPDVWSDQVTYAGGRRHFASVRRGPCGARRAHGGQSPDWRGTRATGGRRRLLIVLRA